MAFNIIVLLSTFLFFGLKMRIYGTILIVSIPLAISMISLIRFTSVIEEIAEEVEAAYKKKLTVMKEVTA